MAYSVTAVPFSIWILKGYYDTVPFDLEEAALIDGCSRLETFWRIILPLSTPGWRGVLEYFMAAWSEFIVAYRILTKPELLTWPLGLNALQGQFQTEWACMRGGAGSGPDDHHPGAALFLFRPSGWCLD